MRLKVSAKYIITVNTAEYGEVEIFNQTPEEVAIWILQGKPFISIKKQSAYYAVKAYEIEHGKEAIAWIEKAMAK